MNKTILIRLSLVFALGGGSACDLSLGPIFGKSVEPEYGFYPGSGYNLVTPNPGSGGCPYYRYEALFPDEPLPGSKCEVPANHIENAAEEPAGSLTFLFRKTAEGKYPKILVLKFGTESMASEMVIFDCSDPETDQGKSRCTPRWTPSFWYSLTTEKITIMNPACGNRVEYERVHNNSCEASLPSPAGPQDLTRLLPKWDKQGFSFPEKEN
jgi:hypothetical protein